MSSFLLFHIYFLYFFFILGLDTSNACRKGNAAVAIPSWRGADIGATNVMDCLHLACHIGHTEVAMALIDKGRTSMQRIIFNGQLFAGHVRGSH
jgi:hypothetical protein